MKIATNDGRLHLADCNHVYASPPLTVADAVEWAQHCDLISVQLSQIPVVTTLAAYTHVGIYTKADHDMYASFPESHYAHHWDGTALHRKVNTGYVSPIYIMQPDSPWRTKHRDDLLTLQRGSPWCSWFFKDTARASYDIGGAPVIPGTHLTDTRDRWERMEQANFAMWDAAVGYQLSCINGLTPDTLKNFSPCIGMVEAAWGLLDGTFPTEAAWEHLGDLAWQAQLAGWTPWLYAKLAVLHGTPFWDAARKFTVPSAMLWDAGSLLYLIGGREGTPPSYETKEYLHPCYHPAIGTPSRVPANWREYLRPEGTYVKGYTNGRVIVNPTPTTITTTLRDGTTHTLDPQSGTIIRRTTTGWTTIL